MAQSVAGTKKNLNSQIIKAVMIFSGVLALLHYWILLVATHFFSFEPWQNLILCVIFGLGVLSIPAAFIISRNRYSSFYFLVWFGYIWLGFFFIALWVSTLYYFLTAFFSVPFLSLSVLWILMIGFFLWSLYKGTRDPVVRKEKLPLSSHLGLKIAQITDLHVGLLRHDEAWLQRIVDKINSEKVDFVVLTGDLVEGSWEQVFPMLKPLTKMQSRFGNLFVSGNHEFIHGGVIWEQALEKMGWKILSNNNLIYNQNNKKILFAGVPDRMVKRMGSDLQSLPDQALRTSEPVDFKILLAHEPASVLDLVQEKPDIILSGHTHGGQIFPFGALVRLAQPMVEGWKKIKDVWVYAHPGTGLWGPPMRLGTTSKIVIFDV